MSLLIASCKRTVVWVGEVPLESVRKAVSADCDSPVTASSLSLPTVRVPGLPEVSADMVRLAVLFESDGLGAPKAGQALEDEKSSEALLER